MSAAKTQQRISFSTVKNRVPYPDLLEVQLKSFRDFFQMDTTAENRKNEGLYKVFQENFPITDTRNKFWSLSTTISTRPVTRSRSAWSAV
jgi:DNA-directed RNA polymerase subunit beta